ncbi:MAG: ATP-binding cassette domain-containing protein [Alphaproteobacteria bacterium]|nr:ATP-binding cassette domain-containing protein [Alphaproteobacteria bacterium]
MPAAIECRGVHKRFGTIRANDGVDLMVAHSTVHGIIGENGAGKSTLMGLLYGHFPPDAGEIRVRGRPVRFRSPKDAIAAGIGMVYQHFVQVETFTVLENLLLGIEGGLFAAGQRAAGAGSFGSSRSRSGPGARSQRHCRRPPRRAAPPAHVRLDMRPWALRARTASQSGGNQQKLVCAREM